MSLEMLYSRLRNRNHSEQMLFWKKVRLGYDFFRHPYNLRMLKSCYFVYVSKQLQRSMCTVKKKEHTGNVTMPNEIPTATDITSKVESSKMVSTTDLKWRTPWHQKEGQHYSLLRTFYKEDSNAPVLKFLQQPIDLSPSSIKSWWLNRKQIQNKWLQQYIPERNKKLGNELAAAHFLVFRGGAVKFFGEDKWIKADQNNKYNLPVHYEPEKILQAIDCSYMELHFEGLVNLRNLQNVEWLRLYSCEYMDDWCMDSIANIFSDTLLYLDIRECRKISERGLGALFKMKKLKILYVDSLVSSNAFEMTCLMLQDLNPDLDIRTE